jgi:hypothetical protein
MQARTAPATYASVAALKTARRTDSIKSLLLLLRVDKLLVYVAGAAEVIS